MSRFGVLREFVLCATPTGTSIAGGAASRQTSDFQMFEWLLAVAVRHRLMPCVL